MILRECVNSGGLSFLRHSSIGFYRQESRRFERFICFHTVARWEVLNSLVSEAQSHLRWLEHATQSVSINRLSVADNYRQTFDG